jgi:Ca-activated chloride channel family protein
VLLVGPNPALAEPKAPPCTEDAMIVFDASGSMAGNLDQGIATLKPRIDEVRSALAEILPTVARVRRVGLITYGPGPYQRCNVKLDLKPTANAADVHHARSEQFDTFWPDTTHLGGGGGC